MDVLTKGARSHKTVWILLLVTVSLLVGHRVTMAIENPIPKYGFLGGVTAWANVSASSGQSGNGYCRIESYTSPSTNINVIGWTWWQCNLLKDGQIIASIPKNGNVKYGASNHQDEAIFIDAFWYGDELQTEGVHDFNHTGSNPSPWRPYNFVSYCCVP